MNVPHVLLFLVILVFAAVATASLIVLLRPLFFRYAMARPNARSSHRLPTPQGGGIAVVAATLVITAAAVAVSPALAAAAWWPLAIAVSLLAVVGWMDDLRGLPVAPRFLLQIISAAIVVWTLPDDLRIVSLLPFWLERALLLLAGVYLVNIVNFMDGLDWMTVAEFVPVCAGVVLVSIIADTSTLVPVVAIGLCGAIIGFAPFNRPVAKLFLGDVGSLPLGLLLFWLLVELAGRGHLAAAILLPLYYLMDATITLARRSANGEMIFQAHRSHFYQRATDLGFSVPEIIARVFAVNVVLAALAVSSAVLPSWPMKAGAVALGACVVAGLLVHWSRGRH